MSVYSGFATRMQEESYWKMIEQLVDVLQVRIHGDVTNQPINEPYWEHKLIKTHKAIAELETRKFQPPKVSPICHELVSFFKGRRARTGVTKSQQKAASPESNDNALRTSSPRRPSPHRPVQKAPSPKPIFIYKDAQLDYRDSPQNRHKANRSFQGKQKIQIRQSRTRADVFNRRANNKTVTPKLKNRKLVSSRARKRRESSARPRGNTLPFIY